MQEVFRVVEKVADNSSPVRYPDRRINAQGSTTGGSGGAIPRGSLLSSERFDGLKIGYDNNADDAGDDVVMD